MFTNVLNTFFSFLPIIFISKHATIIDFTGFYTLIKNWCHYKQSVRNKVIHKNYVFFVTSRNRTFRFGRNKKLVLTNKQKQFCKNLLFLRDTREKCFLRYREPATLGYAMNIQNDVIGLVLHQNCKSKQVTDFIAWPSRCHVTILHWETESEKYIILTLFYDQNYVNLSNLKFHPLCHTNDKVFIFLKITQMLFLWKKIF